MEWTDALALLVIVIGLMGIVVPVLPGSIMIVVTMLIWAAEIGGRIAWTSVLLASAIVVIGNVVKYLIPGRKLKSTVPNQTLLLGAVGAVIGFFVVPVVGALAGFPLGVYLAERRRVGSAHAATSTVAALKAIGVSILIEFAAGVLASAIWLFAAFAT